MQAGRSSLSLRTKLVLLVSGTALVTALLMGGLNFHSSHEIATELAAERLAGEARLAATKVRAVYGAMRNDAAVVSQTPPVRGLLRATLNGGVDPTEGATAETWREQLNRIFTSFLQAHPQYTKIRYIGLAANGRELVRVNKHADGRIEAVAPENMQEQAEEPFFREALKLPRDRIYFSDVTYNREHGKVDAALTPAIRVVLPVFRPDSDERFGMIVINANYHTLLVEALKDIEINGEIYVSDSFGNYIHRAKNGVISRLQVHRNYTSTPPDFISRFASRLQTNGRFSDADRIGYMARLAIDPQQPGDYFGVFLLTPYPELLDGVHGLIDRSLVVGLLIVVAAAAAAALIAERLMRPITQMTGAIRAYTGGNAYLLDLPVNLRDEIGEMSRAFQSLLTRLDLASAHRTKLSTQLEAFIANSVDGFVVINEQGIVEQANPALLNLFGYERDELIGQSVGILMPEGMSQMHDGYMRAYRELGIKTFIGTIRTEDARRKDGTIFPISLSVSEIILADKRIFSAIIRDVSSVREATKLSVQLEAFIANAVDGFIVINERGIIEQVNPALLDLFGYEPPELIGQNVAILMPDAARVNHDSYLQNYRQTGQKTYIGTIRDEQARRKDGSVFPIALSISEVQLSDRRIFSAVIRDMTAIHEAQRKIRSYTAELERSNHELDQFAYSASHDLKAPLRVIDNASRWLEEDLAEKLSDEDRENMTLLRNRVKRMERLLDDLLAYSRIGRAVDERYKESVNAAKLVEDILILLAPPAAMDVKISETFSKIVVTRMPLQQVLQNLINNAIKHHDQPSGTIELDVVENGDWLQFTVRDDGPGIPAEFQDKIFDMFHTLKPRDQVEGSGMGLALVKKTVEFFGGSVRVASQGRGSAFIFTWPRQLRSDSVSDKAA